jgi:hypothetical protein
MASSRRGFFCHKASSGRCIAPLSASVSKILNMAMMAAYDQPLERGEG